MTVSTDPEGMRLSRISARGLAARLQCIGRPRDESGIALVMALGIMLVLTITLTSVITFTASGARDSHRVNAGQKATALAEAGVNNALAVLTANYPGVVTYPGNPNLLTSRTTNYSSGSVTWSGVLESAPSTVFWNDQWRITSIGSVQNPTGPTAAPVTRRTTAIVPIVIPETISIDPATSSLNWVYAFNDVRFEQSVTVRSPVYANRDLTVANTATIAETIPANASGPVRPNKVAVGRDLWLLSPQNKIGHVFGTANPANSLGEIYVQGKCSSKNITPQHTPCSWGAGDDVWGVTTGVVIPPGLVTAPKLTCCSPYGGSTGHPEPTSEPSVLGFWYRNAAVGPYSICDPAQSSAVATWPRFDRPTGTDSPDDNINQSATSARPPFDLTGSTYRCKTGQGELSYDATTKKLMINGAIFIDGSATATANDATYVGRGAVILSGTFSMNTNDKICVKLTAGGDCDTNAPWDPDVSGMFIFAAGDFATELSTDTGTAGNGIEIKKGQFQGGLFAGGNVDATVAGTVVQGPMVSAYGSVYTGQTGSLSFPSIAFPTAGAAGFVGPLPVPKLLAPREFTGG